MVKNYHYKVAYVDYADGFIAKSNEVDNDIEIIPFNNLERIVLNKPSCIITSGNFAIQLRRYFDLSIEGKILIWSIHPHNFLIMVPLPGFLYNLSPRRKKILLNSVMRGYKH